MLNIDQIREIEARAFRAWPALSSTQHLGWVIRASKGYTKRANSANAYQSCSRRSEELISYVESFYRERQQDSIFRLTPLADAGLDAFLESAGYMYLEPSLVMQRNLRARPPVILARDGGHVIDIHEGFTQTWSDDFSRFYDLSADQHLIHDRMLQSIASKSAYASVVTGLDGDSQRGIALAKPKLGFALGVADTGMIGLFDVLVAPDQRRQGLGQALVEQLLDWGLKQDAATAYLQVVASNEKAIALYQRLGFEPAYRYHYRRKTLSAMV